ncbi:MAG: hypothetical protein MK098_11475 [Marinovum sp.]|nr:hypothetical protein [Marinovum sp.]
MHTQPDFSSESLDVVLVNIPAALTRLIEQGTFEDLPPRRKVDGRVYSAAQSLVPNARGCLVQTEFMAFPSRSSASLSIRERLADTCGASQ